MSNWINDKNAVLAAGYLPLEETDVPEGQYISGYEVVEDKIMPVLASYPDPTYIDQRISTFHLHILK